MPNITHSLVVNISNDSMFNISGVGFKCGSTVYENNPDLIYGFAMLSVYLLIDTIFFNHVGNSYYDKAKRHVLKMWHGNNPQ